MEIQIDKIRRLALHTPKQIGSRINLVEDSLGQETCPFPSAYQLCITMLKLKW